MRYQRLQALDILRGDVALVQEVPDFVQPLNAVALLSRHWLAVLADVSAMAAPAELLIGARAPVVSTEMAHLGYWLELTGSRIILEHVANDMRPPGGCKCRLCRPYRPD